MMELVKRLKEIQFDTLLTVVQRVLLREEVREFVEVKEGVDGFVFYDL